MKTKVKEKTNKFGTPLVVLAAVLAVLLVVAMIFSVTNKAKTVYIPVPGEANDDFGGTMLSNYDNLQLRFTLDQVVFDFDDVKLNKYDFVVLDLNNAELCPGDSMQNKMILQFSEDKMNVENVFVGMFEGGADFSSSSYPYFEIPSTKDNFGSFDYTYLLDLRDLKNGRVVLNCYLDGNFSTSNVFEGVASDISLQCLTYSYSQMAEMYDSSSFDSIYLYGFENGNDCEYGRYFEDTTLKLTDCKDSMLYTGK